MAHAPIIASYAGQQGYVLVTDTSSASGAVAWTARAVDITAQVVQAYDQSQRP